MLRNKQMELLPLLTVEPIVTSAYHLWSVSQALFHFHHGLYVTAHLWTQLHVIVIFATNISHKIVFLSHRARGRDSFTLYAGKRLPDSPPAAPSPKIQSWIRFSWQEKQIPAEGKHASCGIATVLGKPLKTEPNGRTIWKPLNTATSRAWVYIVQLAAVCAAQTHIMLVMLQGCQYPSVETAVGDGWGFYGGKIGSWIFLF